MSAWVQLGGGGQEPAPLERFDDPVPVLVDVQWPGWMIAVRGEHAQVRWVDEHDTPHLELIDLLRITVQG